MELNGYDVGVRESAGLPVDEVAIDDLAIEDLAEANGGGWCLSTAGTAGCPSTASTAGSLTCH